MNFGQYIVPFFILLIIVYCVKEKVNIYDAVIDGSESGLKILVKILPTMIIILAAVSMLRASGFLDMVIRILSPLFKKFNVPPEIIPMIILRPISGSGAFGLLSDYMSTFGADSKIGRLASVIMGSTETTFYTIAIYYAETNIRDVKRVIPCAVFGDLVGIILACFIIK